MTDTATPPSDRSLRYWQWRALLCVMGVYLFYYTGRMVIGHAIPLMEEDLGYTSEQLGWLAFALLIAYGVGQAINGGLGDWLGGRRMMAMGALLSMAFCWMFSFMGSSLLSEHEILDWPGFCQKLSTEGSKGAASPGRRIWQLLPPNPRAVVEDAAKGIGLGKGRKSEVAEALRDILKRRDFYQEADFSRVDLPAEAEEPLKRGRDALSDKEVRRLNRLLLEASYPQEMAKSSSMLVYGLLMLVLFWAANGYVQSMGWAPGSRLISNWWPRRERGMAFGLYVLAAGFATMLVWTTSYAVLSMAPKRLGLNEKSLMALREQELPDDLMRELRSIQNRHFATTADFERALTKLVPSHEMAQHREPILREALRRAEAPYWRWLFRIPVLALGLAGIVFYILVRERPEDVGHPAVAEDPPETLGTEEVAEEGERRTVSAIQRYVLVLGHWRFLVACVIILLQNFARYGLLTWMVKYYKDAAGINLKGSLVVTFTLPLGMALGGFCAGSISDKLFRSRRYISIFCFLAAGAVAAIVLREAPATNRVLGMVLMFMIGFTVYGAQAPLWALCPDLVGRENAGTAVGVMDAVAYGGAALQGPLLGFFIAHPDTLGYPAVFLALAIACGTGALLALVVRR